MAVSSSTGSGLDVQSIVSSLIAAERIPITKLESKASDIDVKVSAIGSLRSALNTLNEASNTLQNSSTLGGMSASSSDDSVVEVVSTGSDVLESHSISVGRLASTHRIASTAFASLEDTLTAGTYTFGTGSSSFDIEVSSTMTVDDLRKAINQASDNDLMTATTINTGSGYQLLLSARDGGSVNAITNTPASLGFTEASPAEDGEITIDGLTFATTSNELTDVLPGLSLSIKAVGDANVETSLNTGTVLENLNMFVNAYNDLYSIMERLAGDELQGEGITRNIETRLRTAFFSEVEDSEGVSHSAFEFGLTFDKYGTLSVDSSKVQTAMAENFDGFLSFFSGEDGFASILSDSISALTGFQGVLDSRQTSYRTELGRLDSRIEQMEYRLAEQEDRYYQQYSKLDAMLIQMNDTSSNIASQLTAIGKTD